MAGARPTGLRARRRLQKQHTQQQRAPRALAAVLPNGAVLVLGLSGGLASSPSALTTRAAAVSGCGHAQTRCSSHSHTESRSLDGVPRERERKGMLHVRIGGGERKVLRFFVIQLFLLASPKLPTILFSTAITCYFSVQKR